MTICAGPGASCESVHLCREGAQSGNTTVDSWRIPGVDRSTVASNNRFNRRAMPISGLKPEANAGTVSYASTPVEHMTSPEVVICPRSL